MDQKTATPGHLRDLFPNATGGLLSLFQAAEENTSILRCDFHTLRDWLELADYQHESLHVLLLLLILAQEEGSLCIELSQENIVRRLGDLVPSDQALNWARLLQADLGSQDFSALIGMNPDDHRPIIQHCADGRRYLYFQKFLRHELAFATSFLAKLIAPPIVPPQGNWNALLREILDEQPLRPGGRPLVLDAEQRRALELCLSRNLVLISGGPGTGKTSIVLNLIRGLVRSGVNPERIALAAPTGRAAQRLGDAIQMGLQSLSPSEKSPDAGLRDLRAATLHQLLDYVPSRDLFRRHAENPLTAEVVIVDEVSMVGMVLMDKLFQALGPQARLILLGDKDQLPSVDAGSVLAHLIPDERSDISNHPIKDALVLLRTNHRSEPHIRTIAAAINQQNRDFLEGLPILEMPKDVATTWSHLADERGVRFLDQSKKTATEMHNILRHWADHAYLQSGFKEVLEGCMAFAEEDNSPDRQKRFQELFRLLDQTRILTLIREGPWGCVEMNRYLDYYLRPYFDPHSRGHLFAGAPVLIIRNDPVRQLYNGDVGLTLRGPTGNLRVVFPRQGSFITFPAETLPAHELGFALTVHKSQGSEYDRVLLVFPPTGGRRLLTKEVVYTGITRAKELAILCATSEVLHSAIQKKCTRESGLFSHPFVASPPGLD